MSSHSTDALKTVTASNALVEQNKASLTQCVRIAFVRNCTIEMVEPFLKAALYKEGIEPQLSYGGYGTGMAEILDTSSALQASKPELIVVSMMIDELDAAYCRWGWTRERAQRQLEELFQALSQRTSALLLIHTFIPPFYSETGITHVEGMLGRIEEVHRLNAWIREYVRTHASRFILMDWDRMARQLGEAQSIDYRFWHLTKSPFRTPFCDAYAREIARVVRAIKGKTKKCLVLDCDNTLWGGLIGEDGMAGIALDAHTYPGKAFYQFQEDLLTLHARGVLLALCSKNNEADVRDVLDHHPQSVLRWNHLAAVRVNWSDKAANMQALAQQLSLGLDSFVFMDDNPVECELVRSLLPTVCVIQRPEKVFELPGLVFREGLFDALSLSREDRDRTRQYQTEAVRQQEQAKYHNVDDYLASLQITAAIHPLRDHELARAAQLTQKTNQFNLTTRRYSEAELQAFKKSPDWSIWTLTASDRLGDLGLTGVFMAKREGNVGRIDNLLLSCRVLGRKLESAFIHHCLTALQKQWNIDHWIADYRPTPKNVQTAEFWTSVGFIEAAATNDGRRYKLSQPIDTKIAFITIKD